MDWSCIGSVQSLSCVRLFAIPWTAACEASLSISNSRSLPKLMSIESVMSSNHLILCHPLLLPPQSLPASGSFLPRSDEIGRVQGGMAVDFRVFSNEPVLRISWPKYWSFSFNISPSNEYSDWFPSGWTGWISLLSKGLSRVFSNTTVQKHQFFSSQLSS